MKARRLIGFAVVPAKAARENRLLSPTLNHQRRAIFDRFKLAQFCRPFAEAITEALCKMRRWPAPGKSMKPIRLISPEKVEGTAL
jgi:hypothetical protein